MLGELLLGGVRLAHALAAALWVGGMLVVALLPIGSAPTPAIQWYRQGLRAGIGVFVVSGALLAVERLGSAPLPPTYFALLLLKIALGIWMFAAARRIGLAQPVGSGWTASWARAEVRVIALGVVVYALAIALRSIYEGTVRA